ncbi:hypothetical protein D6825_02280 [Candidatus Woesearchaeota archaeon]|nr:MAG: hypothetical protein D6825_02280 [Candidatus Woesearchaeota archaeon]
MSFDEFLLQFGIKEKVEVKQIYRSFFRVRDESYLAHRPVWVDECLAHIRNGKIVPSVDFLQWVSKRARRWARVGAKAEWLFICGRDLKSSSIEDHNNPSSGDFVVILNDRRECLGYGVASGPLSDGKLTIRRVFDIGDLLRRERKRRKV